MFPYSFRSCSSGADNLTGQTLPDSASLWSNTCNENAKSIKKNVEDYFCICLSKGISVCFFFRIILTSISTSAPSMDSAFRMSSHRKCVTSPAHFAFVRRICRAKTCVLHGTTPCPMHFSQQSPHPLDSAAI